MTEHYTHTLPLITIRAQLYQNIFVLVTAKT